VVRAAPRARRSAAIDFWRRHDDCAGEGATVRSGAVTRLTFAPCAGGSAVELVTIEGGGHSWPGGDRMARFLDPPSTALDATEEIWRFFAHH
jgi:polyhydroxybutyrate depolymerase